MYTEHWIYETKLRVNKRVLCYAMPLMIEALLILTNPITGWIFYIDECNVYARGNLYFVNLIFFCFYILYSLFIVVKHGLRTEDKGRKEQSKAVATFMVFPVIATLIQGGAYGISLIWPYTVLSLLLIYFKVQHKRVEMERMQKFEEKERVARLENELVQSNIAIMLSQIQPHFLYNALQGIG